MRSSRTSSHRARLAIAVGAMLFAACDGGISVPPLPPAAATEQNAQAFIAAMKPRRAGRPLVAVVALNEGTEMTDFLLPHAALERADVADVQAVAPRGGRVSLYPALQVSGVHAFESFDRAHPSGADYIIVPAMREDDDPSVVRWLQQQAGRGARIIGVCVGVLVVGRAGLLDGRRFVTHWHYRRTVLERHPGAVYVPHQRYVVDRDVATTTGITASLPTMVALVEALGGRDKAQTLAAELGITSWTPAHDSSRFGLNAERRWNYLLTKAAFWRHEQWSVDVREGMDDISLALAADAWSRTGRVSVAASAPAPVKLRSGLVLEAQPAIEERPRLPLSATLAPAQQLGRTLCEIAERFGAARRDWVMMELEYAAAATCAP